MLKLKRRSLYVFCFLILLFGLCELTFLKLKKDFVIATCDNCTIKTDGDYKTLIFTKSGNLYILFGHSFIGSVLIGGGGGGGEGTKTQDGGGGLSGEYFCQAAGISFKNSTCPVIADELSIGRYPVVVGLGGSSGLPGGNSVFNGFTVNGGQSGKNALLVNNEFTTLGSPGSDGLVAITFKYR